MALSTDFEASRLAFARSRAGMSRERLSQGVGLSPRTLAYYERGDHAPNEEVIERLAEALGVPSSFFLGQPLDELPAASVSFRALTKMTAVRRDSALASGTLAVELNRWLEARLHLPTPDVPRYERGSDDCESAAQRLRFEWDLGYRKVPNMVQLMEAHGVRVFSLPEHLADVDGFSFLSQGVPFVLLNTRKTGDRGRFDAAHELAHLVIHSDYDMPAGRERELQANRFAAAFLMPETDVRSMGLRNAGPERVIASKRRWGVAAMALTHRLHELGVTSDWTYASTCRRLSQLGYRSGEPDDAASPREASTLLDKVLRMLRERGIRPTEIARDLRVHPATLKELMFGLVLTGVDGQALSSGSAAPRFQRGMIRTCGCALGG